MIRILNHISVFTALISVSYSSIESIESFVEEKNDIGGGLRGFPFKSVRGLPWKLRSEAKFQKDFDEECRAQSYKISEVHDLMNYIPELDCIFHQGYTPSKVPEGPWHGSVLQMLNTWLFNPFIKTVWRGKHVIKTPCSNGNSAFIGWNSLNSIGLLVPFVAHVGPLVHDIGPGEHDDGRESVILDYTADFSTLCPDSVTNNLFPFNQMIDTVRLVGKRDDGGFIYLGKAMVKHGMYGESKLTTAVYFGFVNYDKEVVPLGVY